MTWNVTFTPFIPLWALVALAMVAVAAAVLQGLTRPLQGLLRLLTGALVIGAVANPQIAVEDREPTADIAVLIVDKSDSQSLGQRPRQTDEAAKQLEDRIKALPNTELRVVEVSSGMGQANAGTQLFKALDNARADIPANRFAGAIFITDGEVHDVPQSLTALPLPLHALITGSKKEIDRRIEVIAAPRFGIVGQDQKIIFRVDDQNTGQNVASVTVSVDGVAAPPQMVPPGTEIETTIKVAHAGQNLVQITASPVPGEISLANNTTLTSISGVRDRLRVLLVSGEPHPGERTWRNLLKADTAVDLVHFTILRPPEKQDGTPTNELSLIAFPTRELFVDKLDKFDLVIFDRFKRQAILPDSYLANVADYVKKGGAILVASGPEFAGDEGLSGTPLGDILPATPTGKIIEQAFRPVIAAQGLKHPITQNLSATDPPQWGQWFRMIDATATDGAQTLMTGPEGKPLLVAARVGEGRVAQILSDQGWLWARGYDGGGPQTELLRRIAHWSMKEPDLEEEALGGRQEGKDLVIERRSLEAGHTTAKVTVPDGSTVDVALTETSPGKFTGRLPATKPGLYALSDGKLQAAVSVGSGDTREAADLRATPTLIEPAIAATGGTIAWAEDGIPSLRKSDPGQQMGGAGWMALKANGLYRTLAIQQFRLFGTLLALAALLMAATLMWWREGR